MATWTSNTYEGRYLQLSISESVNVADNTSTLNWTLTSAGGNVSFYTVDTTTVTIDGTEVYYKGRTAWDDRVFPAAKGSVSGSLVVPHNSNGSKTISVSFTTRVYIYGPQEYGGSMVLSDIDRTTPTVSCSVSGITANGFRIDANSSATADLWDYSINGGNSWVRFSSAASTSAAVNVGSLNANQQYQVKVRARKRYNKVYGYSGTTYVKTLGGAVITGAYGIYADDPTVNLKLDVTVYNSSYDNYVTLKNGDEVYLTFAARKWSVGKAERTITLTSSERSKLLSLMADIKNFMGRVELVTKDGSTQVGDVSSLGCYVATSESRSGPSMGAFSVKDSQSSTVSVTGNNQLFIQNYSRLQVTPGTATAKNGATIVKYSASCNGKTYSNTNGAVLNLYGIEKSGSLDVVVTATDSRGYTVSRTQKITVIPYDKPRLSTVSLRRTNDIEAEMQLIFRGSISPVTVSNAQKNSLTSVQYRYKLTSASSYGSYITITSGVSKTGTSFSYSNLQLCNLSANSSYDFELRIADSLGSASARIVHFTVPQGTPLLALRKKKVGINTPTPDAALNVVGTSHLEGSTTIDGYTRINGNTRIAGTLTPDYIDYPFDTTQYCVCTTPADVKEKVVDCPGFRLVKGAMIAVQFDHGSTASTPSLKVGNTDARAICGLYGYYVGANMWVERQIVPFVFNGTWWMAYTSVEASTTRYGPTKLSTSIGSTSTTMAATPSAVKQAYDRSYWPSISLGTALAVADGGTGSTYASGARANLGITCDTLYSGTLSSGSTTFHYGSYNAYIIIGEPYKGYSKMTAIIPKNALTTSDVTYQIADESYFRAFKLRCSGSTVTLTIGNGYGNIRSVYGIT